MRREGPRTSKEGRERKELARMLLELIATLAAGLFAGAAIYIDLAEQPARKKIDIATALTEWRPSYKRAAVVQPILAAVGFLSAIAAWLMGGSIWWLVGGVLLVAVIPYTLIIVFPTNKDRKSVV